MPPILPVPLILLAGGTRRLRSLPGESGGRPLAGYKGVDLRIAGRPVIEHGVRRFADSGAFAPIYIAGPRDLYAGLDYGVAEDRVRFLDTDGAFGDNLRAATEAVVAAHPGSMVAYATADILPTPADLGRALADYRGHSPCDFWMPEHRVPDDRSALGASSWKPQYRIRGENDARPVGTLPGHLVIADPRAVRRQLTYEIFDLAYGTRTLSIPQRTWRVAFGLGTRFAAAEMEEIRQGRRPTVLWDILVHGLLFASELWRGIDHRRMEDRIRKIYLHRLHRQTYPNRRGRVAVLEIESLAKDVDTEEEAQELEARLADPDGLPSQERVS